jgi:hypothetical protein
MTIQEAEQQSPVTESSVPERLRLKTLMYMGIGSSAAVGSGLTMDVIAAVSKNVELAEGGAFLAVAGIWLTSDFIKIIRSAKESSTEEADTLSFPNIEYSVPQLDNALDDYEDI